MGVSKNLTPCYIFWSINPTRVKFSSRKLHMWLYFESSYSLFIRRTYITVIINFIVETYYVLRATRIRWYDSILIIEPFSKKMLWNTSWGCSAIWRRLNSQFLLNSRNQFHGAFLIKPALSVVTWLVSSKSRLWSSHEFHYKAQKFLVYRFRNKIIECQNESWKDPRVLRERKIELQQKLNIFSRLRDRKPAQN